MHPAVVAGQGEMQHLARPPGLVERLVEPIDPKVIGCANLSGIIDLHAVGAQTAKAGIDRVQDRLLRGTASRPVAGDNDELVAATADLANGPAERFLLQAIEVLTGCAECVDPGIQCGRHQRWVVDAVGTKGNLRDPESRAAERAVAHLAIGRAPPLILTGATAPDRKTRTGRGQLEECATVDSFFS